MLLNRDGVADGRGARRQQWRHTQMDEPTQPDKPDPKQSDIGRGTPPARTPETLPETDLQPEQTPVRDTPDVQAPRTPPAP
jgi:hypothetical protein